MRRVATSTQQVRAATDRRAALSNLARRGAKLTVVKVEVALGPRAREAARTLPAPAQRVLRKGRATLSGSSPAGAGGRFGERPPAPAATPRGPAPRQWRRGYEELVSSVLPIAARWLVASPGSPGQVTKVGDRRGTGFPRTRGGRPLVNDVAHVAHLDALRFEGFEFFVVPEGSRPWFRQQAELRDHVTEQYALVADQADAGAVFDLTPPATRSRERQRSLRGEVAEVAASLPEAPAVLDWTDGGIAKELPGFTTFRPPASVALPYLDESVDIVVYDTSRDAREAMRVASHAAIGIDVDSSGHVAIANVEVRGHAVATETARVVVWSDDPDHDERWRQSLTDRVDAAGATLRLGPIDREGVAAVGDADVVVVVEPYVLPLPMTIERAATIAAADPGAVIAGKVLRGDGHLEAAGGTVFFDRSVALIAHGSADVSAPWHEYVRPVCFAAGIVASTGAMWKTTAPPPHLSGRAFVLLC
jgi:hypothetical protein